MKRKSILSCLLAGILAVLAGCGESGVSFQKQGAFYQVYNVVYDCEHEVGRQDGDAWAARNDLDPSIGNLAVVSGVTLPVGVYKLTWDMTVDYNASDIATVVGVVYIRDSETGEAIYQYDIMRKDIETVYQFNDVVNLFPMYVEKTVDIVFEWQLNTQVKLRQMEIVSVSPAMMRDPSKDAELLFGEPETDIIENSPENALFHFNMDNYVDDLLEYPEYVYDMAYLMFTLQGLVNRDSSRLWMTFSENSTDEYWLAYLSEDGRYLDGRPVVEVKEPATLLALFEDEFTGFAVWDPQVPATSNVAATICGVEDRLPVRYKDETGSIFRYLSEHYADRDMTRLDGKFTGTGVIPDTDISSTGSAKNDAYRWAIEKYLKTGKTNPTLMAYHVDGWTDTYYNGQAAYPNTHVEKTLYNRHIANKDYYIANKAFFFDLSFSPSVPTTDEPDVPAGTDYATLNYMLTEQNKVADSDMTTVGGFWPWDIKYNEEGTAGYEEPMVILLSKYNCILDAEAPGYTNMANASVYQHIKTAESYTNIAGDKRAEVEQSVADGTLKLENKNYLLFFMGDYDSSAWTNRAMNVNYLEDQTRGTIPLVWPICPNNEKKVPHVLNAMYENQTANDYFCYVNSGLGQFIIDGMLESDRPAGLNGTPESYIEATNLAGAKYDLDFIGFMGCNSIRGLEYYAGLDNLAGVVNTRMFQDHYFIDADKTIPVSGFYNLEGITLQERGAWLQTRAVRQKMADGSDFPGARPNFIVVRSILQRAQDMLSLYQYVTETYPDYSFEVVDPYTYFALYAMAYGT